MFNRQLLPLWLIVLTISITHIKANAQQPNRCGTVEVQQRLEQQDPTLAARMASLQQKIQQYIASHPNQKQQSILTIPVVVHVVSNGEPVGSGTNLSDAQILSEIDVLNQDYRRLNSDTGNTPSAFKSLTADMEIEFCMAVRDPNGMPTNGIDRINGGQNTWTENTVDNNLKPTTIWSPSKYLNIWTVKLGGSSAGILGYAIMPGIDSTIDGVVIGYQYFGNTGTVSYPYDKGRTCTHEVGHWLGLYHPWSRFNDPNVSSCNDDDGIADTPNSQYGNYGCPSYPHISCNNGPNGDMFMDYMDYTDDACMNMFTQGQKTSVWATVNNARPSILTSQACTRFNYDAALRQVLLPSSQVCDGNFSPLVLISNEGNTNLTRCQINYILDGSGFNVYSWTGNLAPGQSEYVTIASLNTTPGNHSIELFVSSPNNQNDQNTANDGQIINFVVLTSSPGNYLPLTEGFESIASLPFGWERDSTGADTLRWQITTVAGSQGSLASVWMDNHTGTSGHNSRGKRDFLIAPAIFVKNNKYPRLTFDVAYAQRDTTSADSLIVSYSIDCGANWYKIYAKGGSALATSPINSDPFVPSGSEWRSEQVFLPNVSNQDHLLIRFENYSDWGNNIYLDNININEQTVGIHEVATNNISLDFQISPNPSNGMFNLHFSQPIEQSATLQVFDLLGKSVYLDNHVTGSDFSINLSGNSAGIYLVKLVSNGQSLVKKVVIR